MLAVFEGVCVCVCELLAVAVTVPLPVLDGVLETEDVALTDGVAESERVVVGVPVACAVNEEEDVTERLRVVEGVFVADSDRVAEDVKLDVAVAEAVGEALSPCSMRAFTTDGGGEKGGKAGRVEGDPRTSIPCRASSWLFANVVVLPPLLLQSRSTPPLPSRLLVR